MSFVIPTAKVKFNVPEIPGPGEYIQINENIQKSSCAPFNSSGLRRETESKKQMITPGPGQYQQINVKAVYDFRPPGTNTFKSKVPRFADKKRSASEAAPERHKSGDKLNVVTQSSKTKKNEMMDLIRSSNNKRKISSIKNPKQFVRVVYTDPHNTQNHISKYVNVDFINKNVGPGDYDIQTSMAQAKGVKWEQYKSKRFKTVSNDDTIGPGSYDVDTTKDNRNVSSSFASQSIRSYFDNIIYKTNIKDLAHLREYINYKDIAPGPGHYQSTIIEPAVNNTFQFFGSTSERFLEKAEFPTSNLGPGSYDVDKKHEERRTKNRNQTKSVLQKRNNVQYPVRRTDTPGPGQYSSSVNTLKEELFDKFRKGYHGDFGTKETRFKTQSVGSKPLPGPGDYSPQKVKLANIPVNTSYIAQSKRASSLAKQSTPFGQYNIGVYDLARVLSKKKEFLQNLRKIQVYKPPFQSAVERFKTENLEIPKQDEVGIEQINLLSQAYNEKRRLLKPYKGSDQTGNFKSRSKRFLTSVANIPPPGYYSSPAKIQKDSYNVKYGYKKKT